MGTPDKDLLREVTPDGEERLLYDHCPGAYARTTVAIEADRAWRWWSKSQLALLYPGGVPTAVIDAVEVCEATRFAWKAEGERLRKIETDKK